jgi:hypothetical protein
VGIVDAAQTLEPKDSGTPDSGTPDSGLCGSAMRVKIRVRTGPRAVHPLTGLAPEGEPG